MMVALPFPPTKNDAVCPSWVRGGRRRGMAEAEHTIQGAGASGQALADFRALAEATTPDVMDAESAVTVIP